MKVVREIKRKDLVEISEVDPENYPCLLNVIIDLIEFDDGKYTGSITAKEDGYVRKRINVSDFSKRKVNNRLKIFGLSI